MLLEKPMSPDLGHVVFKHKKKQIDISEFPYKTVLSFEPLIEYWKKLCSSSNKLTAENATRIYNEISKVKAFRGDIEDVSVLKSYEELLQSMMSAIVPPIGSKDYSLGLSAPFSMDFFYGSPDFLHLLKKEHRSSADEKIKKEIMFGKTVNALMYIAYYLHGVEYNFDYPVIYHANDPKTGLARYYKLEIDSRFSRIEVDPAFQSVSKEEMKYLVNNINDVGLWLQYFPPRYFKFYGFVILYPVDVTDHEAISQIKYDLLDDEALMIREKFLKLEEKIRTLLSMPNLRLGLISFYDKKHAFIHKNYEIKNSLVCKTEIMHECCYENSIYQYALNEGPDSLFVISDLTGLPTKTIIEDELLANGIKSIAIIPLIRKDELIGIMELGSPNPGELKSGSLIKIMEVSSLFSLAIKRAREEFNHKIEAVIKEKCTAVHSSVEWRFRKAAINLLDRKDTDKSVQMEDIVFKDVYPLFGVADIRASSIQRNVAIQGDLIEQLKDVSEIISVARGVKPLPFLDELNYRVTKHLSRIENGLDSGDEIAVTTMFDKDINPLFENLKSFGNILKERIDNYYLKLGEYDILYKRRKDFEESFMTIITSLSALVEEEETKAQSFIPHYFEKYKTDGVEYSIYAGPELLPDGKFDLMYLNSLRLWQLFLMCALAKQADILKKDLKVPLETTNLILVQTLPLSIRFRYDEKKFDVDGAYNIRYEIMKKRIDKSYIKGTNERLTRPGSIAIIYSQQKEVSEYIRYLEYLQSTNFITSKIEKLDIEELQGIHGLKALRVDVNLDAPILENSFFSKEVVIDTNMTNPI